jgi:hypothetical protein
MSTSELGHHKWDGLRHIYIPSIGLKISKQSEFLCQVGWCQLTTFPYRFNKRRLITAFELSNTGTQRDIDSNQ